MRPLSAQQMHALRLAAQGELVSSYGNEFFLAQQASQGTAERNTLMSLHKRGLLRYRPGLSGRGEFKISSEGIMLLKDCPG